ncbi:intraflagellar transport protein 22 homolog isoform X2 [Echeneis naucrates]|uniref:intraflagellar transport protein 22 homolog isoform X2 n=1 Tax=Echeneis naucrates TaxID=173247 RepID=UPI0011144AA4|nr:intraflagellar transport protein 22 homolog isoform X2 [Echeneis naucrates]
MFKAKILFVGPSESGKSVLANFLSDTTETVGGEYSPTQGVRFESCWPALMKDSSGVVIIFNPDVPSQLKEIETWFSMFISSQGLQDNQCLLMAHHKPGSDVKDGRLPLASHLSKLPLIHSNLEEEPEDVRRAFCRYLGTVVNTMSESREREEMSIIT